MVLKAGFCYDYNEESDNLLNYLTDCSQKQPAFRKILKRIGVKNFLIEENYVDKDHLVDYSNYYARCHYPYSRFCTRVHFFKKLEKGSNQFEFSDKLLSKIIRGKGGDKLIDKVNSIYLGFIVLKEFKNDKTLIGKTCLVHYPESQDRKYGASRNYSVSLYGIPLSVRTMAFQEQDETIGMCASIALWSAFNITGIKYQHKIPSPSEVTKLALTETSYSRLNEGMTAEQIAVGISKVGLNPMIISPIGNRDLKSIIYAYLRAGIPVICGIWLFDEYINGTVDPNSISYHAVTINGYSFENGCPDVVFDNDIRFYSNRMTKFYVHDDQLCPFAKMKITDTRKRMKNLEFKGIDTTWLTENHIEKGLKEFKTAKVNTLIVPLDPKIRISYSEVLSELEFLSDKLSKVVELLGAKIDFEWDIFLTDVSSFKKDVLSGPFFAEKSDFLKKSYAKYLWRTKAVLNKVNLFEIIFDATDTAKGGITKDAIFYDEKYKYYYDLIK